MAQIQNDRDKLLQAAAIRFVLPSIDPGRIPGLEDAIESSKNLRIRASSAIFKIGMGGVASPTSIQLEAIASQNLSGTVVWTVTNGSATLTGTGNTRTLTPNNLISVTATIRATLTVGSKSYYDEWTVTKVADGAQGSSGADGTMSFKSTAFLRSNTTPATPTGGTFATPIPAGWSDGVPAGDAKLWATTRIFTATGIPPQQAAWTAPHAMTDTASFEAMYNTLATSPGNPTANPTNWTATAGTNTIWMATRTQKNGVWSAWQVSKIKGETGDKGANGAAGANGSRGSGTAFSSMVGLIRQNRGTRAKWSSSSNSNAGDTAATNVIYSRFGSPLVLGDTVTLTNTTNPPTLSITGYWNGSQWTDPGVIIDGNLLVSGDISGQSFTGGTFTGAEFIAKEAGVVSSLTITYGSTPNGTRLPKLEIRNHLNQMTSHLSPGRNIFSSGSIQPSVDVYNDFTGTSNDAHGVRAKSVAGVGVGGESDRNDGGLFLTKGNNKAGVRGQGDHLHSDGVYGEGKRYGGVFGGDLAAIKLLVSSERPAAENGSLVYNQGKLWLRTGSTWRSLTMD